MRTADAEWFTSRGCRYIRGTSLCCRTMKVASQQNTTPIRRPLRQTRVHEWIFFVGMTIKVN
jgi:hypothetical protein